MESKKKKYPDKIERSGFSLTKSQKEFLIRLNPVLPSVLVQEFFEKHKHVIEINFKNDVKKSQMIVDFNKSSVHTKWVTRVVEDEKSIDEIMHELGVEEEVNFVSPLYSREDLKRPNAFTFIDQLIIRFPQDTKKEYLQEIFKDLGVEEVQGRRGELGKGLMLLHLTNPKIQNCYEIAKKLTSLAPSINYCDVDWIQLHSGLHFIPNDPFFCNQWNLRNIGQTMPYGGDTATTGCDINIVPAWDITRGSPLVVIAVCDTGCDLKHPDLIDNYVQSDRWYSSLTGTNNPQDSFGHGTCVAGVAAARGNNQQGIAGVSFNCRILPIQMYALYLTNVAGIPFLDFNHESQSETVNALNQALNNHVKIINISWGWDLEDDDVIKSKLEECYQHKIVIIASTGDNNQEGIAFPASHKNVIAVGASDQNDNRWLGSNFGKELSVVAPGQYLWSTDIRGLKTTNDAGNPVFYKNGFNDSMGGGDCAGDYFDGFGGTSGAVPHVAGLAALILSYNPTLSPADVRKIIEDNAKDLMPASNIPGSKWDKYTGFGRIDAGKTMQDVVTNHPFPPPNSVADVYIRDSLTDDGTQPYVDDPLCFSPDIIVRKARVLNPQTDFANISVDPGSDNVEIGNDNYIYLRVHNKGTFSSDIHARVYYAPLSTTCSPDKWKIIGQIDFYNVPASGYQVSDALIWEKVPDPCSVGHFCIIASIEGFGDPHPDPEAINTSSYADFIRKHNNISYRNVVFENALPDTVIPVNFIIGAFLGIKEFDLRIRMKNPKRADIHLNIPNYVYSKYTSLENISRTEGASKYFLRHRVEEGENALIKGFVMPQSISDLARLEIRIPSDAEQDELYEIAIEQIFEGKVVGDFTVKTRIVDPKRTMFIAVRDSRFVHRANCEHLPKTNHNLWIPFGTLTDARASGYDLALDCLNQEFRAVDVSWRLSKKVLNFINNINSAEELNQTVKEALRGLVTHNGELMTQGKFEIDIDIAKKILEARDKICRFENITQIEQIDGVGIDKFIALVNAVKVK